MNSENSLLINVGKPTRQPFMNFSQDFRSKYEGEPKTVREMATMAGEVWRNMTDQEKTPYRALANAEKQKPKAAAAKESKRPKQVALKELKTMTTKFTQLEKVVKRLQARPKLAPYQRAALPPQRRATRRAARKPVSKVARKAAHKPGFGANHKQAPRSACQDCCVHMPGCRYFY